MLDAKVVPMGSVTVTKDFLKAARDTRYLDTVLFRWDGEKDNGVRWGHIQLLHKKQDTHFGTDYEVWFYYDLEVKVRFAYVWQPDNIISACADISYIQQHSHWQTIASFLRVGDDIWLEFMNNENQYVKDSITNNEVAVGMKLHKDECWLHVKRGEKRYSFLIDTSVCPNNSARMIRFI